MEKVLWNKSPLDGTNLACFTHYVVQNLMNVVLMFKSKRNKSKNV